MKAILVIDIDEIETCDAEVCVYKNDIPYQGFSRIKLKPMPQKNKYDVNKWATVDYENNITLGHYMNIAWNECIDEIAGEEQ